MEFKIVVEINDESKTKIELIEEEVINGNAIVYFYHDENKNYLEHSINREPLPAHSIQNGALCWLGENQVHVIERTSMGE